MKNEQILRDMTFNNMLRNLGIDPMEIEVIEPEIITNDEPNFRDWYFRIGGNMNFTESQIATGWQNHLEKWNDNKNCSTT